MMKIADITLRSILQQVVLTGLLTVGHVSDLGFIRQRGRPVFIGCVHPRSCPFRHLQGSVCQPGGASQPPQQ